MSPRDKKEILERIEKLAVVSPHFTFLVGENRVPITIHADIVTNLSAPLAALINNGVMTESTTRVAVLDDVQDWVFGKFCQFAYTGSYSVKSETATNASSPDDNSEYVRHRIIDAEIQQSLMNTVPDEDTPLVIRRLTTELWRQFSVLRSVSRSQYQSTSIHTTHVGVYLFATRYLIEPLRQRCLDYLHYELKRFAHHLSPPMLVEFLDKIYESTTPYEPGGHCALRDLIIRFAVCHIQDLRKEETFEELIEKHPEIALDLLKVLTE